MFGRLILRILEHHNKLLISLLVLVVFFVIIAVGIVEGKNAWILLASNVTSNRYDWDTTLVSDGYYQIKIVALCAIGMKLEVCSRNGFLIRNTLPLNLAVGITVFVMILLLLGILIRKQKDSSI